MNSNVTTTDYSGSYVYQEGDLQFIFTPEGYATPNGSTFDYVYQYKDHLGNIRLSYSDANNNGTIEVTSDPLTTEIIEENNYYPFGLRHKGYNNVVNGVEYNYKTFQGQEYTEDLGLNIHEWKYRISDPAIGRFWQVDPLAEDYVHNGVYNFSENRVIDAYELEGAEAVVITEEGTYSKLNVGHTFVTVGSGENTVAYTYGRYAELGKDKGSLNPTNLSGEGVLIRLEGQEAIDMVDKYVNDFGAEAFEFTNADESKVAGFFEEQFNSSDKIPETGDYAGDDRARVIDTYSLSDNNCTTISCEGVSSGTNGNMTYKKEYKNNPKLAGGKGTVEMNIISATPRGLQTQLNEASKDPNSGVKNVTNNYIKKRIK
jgi:RHS repeat-associated protein